MCLAQGSQGRKTPTVVLSVGQMRILHMKQCMSGGKNFESASLDLADGDVFMLHPEDEMIY